MKAPITEPFFIHLFFCPLKILVQPETSQLFPSASNSLTDKYHTPYFELKRASL